jgi:MerR family transcriptional regulator, light-induced transcriptional regulator
MDLSQQILAQRHAQDQGLNSPKSDLGDVNQRPLARPHPDSSESHAASLSRIIESQIIPRLMLAHRAAQGASPLPAVDVHAPGPEAIAEFANIVISNGVSVAAAYVEAQRASGMSLESVYIDLLSPTARHLGYLWENDLCDFTEVTAGLWRLQQLLHELSPAFQGDGAGAQLSTSAGLSRPKLARRALLLPAPGDQHTFGLFMVSEFFRRADWDVWGELPASTEQLINTVREERFDMVGFSVGSVLKLEELKFAIRAVRLESRNKNITVMVGGPIFVAHPEYVDLVGADMTAADGRDAVIFAEELVAQFEVRS